MKKWTKAMFPPISADAWSGLWRKQQRCLLDLERDNFSRKEIGKRFTKKLQTPAPRRRGYSPTCGAGTTAS